MSAYAYEMQFYCNVCLCLVEKRWEAGAPGKPWSSHGSFLWFPTGDTASRMFINITEVKQLCFVTPGCEFTAILTAGKAGPFPRQVDPFGRVFKIRIAALPKCLHIHMKCVFIAMCAFVWLKNAGNQVPRMSPGQITGHRSPDFQTGRPTPL
jgi:hypothetical protein